MFRQLVKSFRTDKTIFKNASAVSVNHDKNNAEHWLGYPSQTPAAASLPAHIKNHSYAKLFSTQPVSQPVLLHPYMQWALNEIKRLDPAFFLQICFSDIAGTLVNPYCTLPLIIFANIFAQKGFKLSAEQITGPMGLKKIEHIRHLLTEIKESWYEKYGCYPNELDAVALNQTFEQALLANIAKPKFTALTPHTKEVIPFIKNLNMQLATTSGYPRKAADLAMTEFFKHFSPDASTTSDEVIGGKRIEMVHACMLKLNKSLDQLHRTFFMTDAQSDVLSIRSASPAAHMPWIVGLANYGAHVGVVSDAQANALAPDELQARRDKSAELLSAAHIVIQDMSELPLAIVAIQKALQAGLRPSTTKKINIVYPEACSLHRTHRL